MIDLYPNETLPILWVIFMVVLAVLNTLVFKPTLKIIEARKGQTDTLQGSANQLIEDNKVALIKYEQTILQARQHAALERDRIIKEARKLEAENVSKARLQAEQMVSEMQERLKEEREESVERLNKYALQMAKDVSEKILERVA